MKKEELVVVIPAYEPNELLINLINKLNEFFTDVPLVIVNDGSKNEGVDKVFSEAAGLPNTTILTHKVNMGKGRALKTAYEYIKTLDGHKVIVTADSDGQHRPEDILRVCEYYYEFNSGLILGSRMFDGKVPFRSRFGNDTTRLLFGAVNSLRINDNQTGLRAFGSELLDLMISIEGERYEYEMNVLSEMVRNDVDIHEIKIETVYIENNAASHFRPVRDFTRICKCIFKYTRHFYITILFEAIFFTLLYFGFSQYLWHNHLALTTSVASATIALIMNILMHVFDVCYANKNMFNIKKKLIKYILVALAMVLGVSGITVGFNMILPIWAAKIIADVIVIVVFILCNFLFRKKIKAKME